MKIRRPIVSSIECLEARVAPATIAATLANGVLKLFAPDLGVAVNGGIAISDADTVQVYDGPNSIGVFDGVKSIKVTLTDLDDSVAVYVIGSGFRGPISYSTGLGVDTLTFNGDGMVGITSDLTVTAKAATQVFVSSGVKLTGTTSITVPGGIVKVDGKLGALNVTDAATVDLTTTSTIFGSARITAPLAGITLTASGLIEGNLSVTGSKALNLEKVTLAGTTQGRVALALGEGASEVTGVSGFFIGDALSITGSKAGPDVISLTLSGGGGFAPTAISGPVMLSLGGSNNSVSILGNGRIAGGLRVATTDGNDTVTMNNASVGGIARFDLGDGTNVVNLTSNIVGGLAVTGGSGQDTVITSGLTALGAAKFSLRDGPNSSNHSLAIFEGGVTTQGGTGGDTVIFGGVIARGKTSLALGDGINSFESQSSFLRTAFSYVGGNIGQDTVNIGPNSTLAGSFTMNAGNGANVLIMQTLSNLSAFTYKGGINVDTVILGENGGEFVRGKVALGDGDDQVQLRNAKFVSFTFDGGTSVDTILQTTAAAALGATIKNFEVNGPLT